MTVNARKWSLLIITLSLLIGFTFHIGVSASSKSLIVCPSGCEYSSIQNAIDAADPGDIVEVKEGTYEENLVINKNLTLQGPNQEKVKIKGTQKNSPVIRVGSSPIKVKIKHMTINGGLSGVSVLGKAKLALIHSLISGSQLCGVEVAPVAFAFIAGSTISKNGSGIRAENPSEIEIIDSTISENKKGGISLLDSVQASIKGSSIVNNGSFGLSVQGLSQVRVENSTFRKNGGHGINLLDSVQASINDTNIVKNSGVGIGLNGSSRVSISDSTISENKRDGIELYDSVQASINDTNIVKNSGYGIVLGGSSRVSINNSTISGNHSYGIVLYSSSQASLINSIISGNDSDGVSLWDSSRLNLIKCSISGNKKAGIDNGSSEQVIIKNNEIFNNNIGINVSGELKGCGNYVYSNVYKNFQKVSPEKVEELISPCKAEQGTEISCGQNESCSIAPTYGSSRIVSFQLTNLRTGKEVKQTNDTLQEAEEKEENQTLRAQKGDKIKFTVKVKISHTLAYPGKLGVTYCHPEKEKIQAVVGAMLREHDFVFTDKVAEDKQTLWLDKNQDYEIATFEWTWEVTKIPAKEGNPAGTTVWDPIGDKTLEFRVFPIGCLFLKERGMQKCAWVNVCSPGYYDLFLKLS